MTSRPSTFRSNPQRPAFPGSQKPPRPTKIVQQPHQQSISQQPNSPHFMTPSFMPLTYSHQQPASAAPNRNKEYSSPTKSERKPKFQPTVSPPGKEKREQRELAFLKEIREKRLLMETQLNVFKASSRSRSPVERREEREESKGKETSEEHKREESDQRKDLLNLLDQVTKEEEKEQIGESKIIDPSPRRAPTSFSDIGGRTKRPKEMRDEEVFKVIKSAAELEQVNFKHLDFSKISADLASTTRKPVSPPTRMQLSPQKRREKQQRLIDGAEQLKGQLDKHMRLSLMEKWIRLYNTRLEFEAAVVQRVRKLHDRLIQSFCFEQLRSNRAERKKEKEDDSKAGNYAQTRLALKCKYIIHKLRKFAAAQRKWVKSTQQYFELEKMRRVYQRMNEFRNTSLATKYINRLRLKRLIEKGLKPVVQKARLNKKASMNHWAISIQQRAMRALRMYREIRKMKKKRTNKADIYRRFEVYEGVFGVWKKKFKELQAIKADKIMRLGLKQDFLNLQIVKTVITKRNPIIPLEDGEVPFNDGIQNYEQIKMSVSN